ncbi:hypothetical protein ACSS6W_000215 [Trichoderma asperelloides]
MSDNLTVCVSYQRQRKARYTYAPFPKVQTRPSKFADRDQCLYLFKVPRL